MTRTRAAVVVVVVGFLVVVSQLVSVSILDAQAPSQAPPVRIRVQVTHVKADMVQQWQNLVRTEAIPAQKKAGVAWRHTWQDGGPFGEGATFYSIQPITNLAQFDQPSAVSRGMSADAFAKYQARLTPMIVSTRAWIDTLQPNESADSGAKSMQPLAVVSTWQVLPGKIAEFMELWRTEYLPRYKKAGVRDVWVYASNYGGPLGQVTIVRPISKYAELDQTPGLLQRGGLTPEAAGKINARRATLVSAAQQTVVRYLPDLSYGMPARATN
jgi:hypothetical protein